MKNAKSKYEILTKENLEFKRQIDSLETLNNQGRDKILLYEDEIIKLEQNIAKSENDKRRLQVSLNNFRASNRISDGVELLKINLANEKDTN